MKQAKNSEQAMKAPHLIIAHDEVYVLKKLVIQQMVASTTLIIPEYIRKDAVVEILDRRIDKVEKTLARHDWIKPQGKHLLLSQKTCYENIKKELDKLALSDEKPL